MREKARRKTSHTTNEKVDTRSRVSIIPKTNEACGDLPSDHEHCVEKSLDLCKKGKLKRRRDISREGRMTYAATSFDHCTAMQDNLTARRSSTHDHENCVEKRPCEKEKVTFSYEAASIQQRVKHVLTATTTQSKALLEATGDATHNNAPRFHLRRAFSVPLQIQTHTQTTSH